MEDSPDQSPTRQPSSRTWRCTIYDSLASHENYRNLSREGRQGLGSNNQDGNYSPQTPSDEAGTHPEERHYRIWRKAMALMLECLHHLPASKITSPNSHLNIINLTGNELPLNWIDVDYAFTTNHYFHNSFALCLWLNPIGPNLIVPPFSTPSFHFLLKNL